MIFFVFLLVAAVRLRRLCLLRRQVHRSRATVKFLNREKKKLGVSWSKVEEEQKLSDAVKPFSDVTFVTSL